MSVQMVQVMIWPVVILIMFLVFVLLFREPVSGFVRNLQNFSFKGPAGVEISAAAAVGNLALAVATSQTPTAMTEAPELLKQVKDLMATPRTMRRLSDAAVLWVDDRPQNNVYERAALEALGIHFVTSLSTEDALAKVRTQHFDVIISDMGRPPDARAGYTLLGALRNAGNKTPFIIYAGSNAQEHKEMARQRGAQGSTNLPPELFQLVISSIEGLTPVPAS